MSRGEEGDALAVATGRAPEGDGSEEGERRGRGKVRILTRPTTPPILWLSQTKSQNNYLGAFTHVTTRLRVQES